MTLASSPEWRRAALVVQQVERFAAMFSAVA